MAKLRFLLGTFFIVVSTWLSGPADGGESVLPPPGTILSETKRDLGQGYFDVKRSQVNPPGHWEGIGHFGFVFYREQSSANAVRRRSAFRHRVNSRFLWMRQAVRLRCFMLPQDHGNGCLKLTLAVPIRQTGSYLIEGSSLRSKSTITTDVQHRS